MNYTCTYMSIHINKQMMELRYSGNKMELIAEILIYTEFNCFGIS